MQNKKSRKSILISLVVVAMLILSVSYIASETTTTEASAASAVTYNYLTLENEGLENGLWKIKVTNTHSSDITVIYNTKMCWASSAENWQGLTDIDSTELKSSGSEKSKTLYVMPNGNAGYVAFSYIANDKRIITYANNLWSNDLTAITPNYATLDYYSDCLEIEIVSGNGGVWVIKVSNKNDYEIDLEYNTKMCFENDAKNWNLSDVNTDYPISNSGDKNVSITTNWFATCVAVSYTEGNSRYVTYGYNLNSTSKTMTVRTVIIPK